MPILFLVVISFLIIFQSVCIFALLGFFKKIFIIRDLKSSSQMALISRLKSSSNDEHEILLLITYNYTGILALDSKF